MGERVLEQARLASRAVSECDITIARKVMGQRKAIRDLDMEALETNTRLFAIHQPVARDLRLVLTLSRAIYDLERISGEAVRLADIAEIRTGPRSEERRVGKEGRAGWSPYP